MTQDVDVEQLLEAAFAKVADAGELTPLETARTFISFAVHAMHSFCTGETLQEELDGAAEFIADAKAQLTERPN